MKHNKSKTQKNFQKYKSLKRKKAETILYQQTEGTVCGIQDYAYTVIRLLNRIEGDATEMNKIKDKVYYFVKSYGMGFC
jgi:hypothetical protein